MDPTAQWIYAHFTCEIALSASLGGVILVVTVVVSAVTRVTDPAGRFCCTGGGISAVVDCGWIPCARLPLARVVVTVVLMAAAPPGSQDASGFRAHLSCDADVPRISGGDCWGVTEAVRSVSIKVNTARAERSLVPRRCFRSCCCLSRYELHASTGMCGCYGSMMAGLWVPTSTFLRGGPGRFMGLRMPVDFVPHCT